MNRNRNMGGLELDCVHVPGLEKSFARELMERQAGYDRILHVIAGLIHGAAGRVPTFRDVVDAELAARELCRYDMSPGDEDIVFDQWADRQKRFKGGVL